jgi:ankyrin repeat protein
MPILEKKLFKAARDGDIAKARAAIKAGADVNFTSYDPDWDWPDHDAVQLAAWHGHVEMVRLLKEYGAVSRYYLEEAIHGGNLELVRLWQQEGIDVNRRIDEDGRSLAFTAIGWFELLELLVDMGLDVNRPDRWGTPPLAEAIGRKKVDPRVLALLWAKASPRVRRLVAKAAKGNLPPIAVRRVNALMAAPAIKKTRTRSGAEKKLAKRTSRPREAARRRLR